MFEKWKERRRRNKETKDFGNKMKVFKELEDIEQHGLISLDVQKHRVLIEENMAMIMMNTPDLWIRFLTALYQYTWYKYYERKYQQWRTEEGAKAVMEARKKYSMLTKADILRIKEARWMKMQLDSVQMPKVEPLEFYLVRIDAERMADEKKENDVPAGDVTIVGRYDYEGNIMEMATWKEMISLMKNRENMKK